MPSPDVVSAGFLNVAPLPLRYAGDDAVADPIEGFGRLRALMPTNVRVLDVGCGGGAGTLAMNEGKGNCVVCLEPDPERSDAARQRGLDCLTAGLDDSTVDSLGAFDIVVFADVLEHLPNPAEALSLAKRLLSPGGSVLVSVPNTAHWTIRAKLLFGRFDYEEYGLMDATHLRWFTFKSLRLMLERCGFSIAVTTGTVGAWLPCYSWLRGRRYFVSALRRMMPAAFSCQLVMKATARQTRAAVRP